jgi:exonuclease SbcC
MLQKNLTELTKQIESKKKVEEQIKQVTNQRHWLQELFLPVVQTIERKILLKIFNEFNTFFSSWFDQLVGDQQIQVQLDEQFSPQITQNGYDTNVENLSGGEKTAVALSYRLALNKVLNDYFGSLHTKGLLILDEPTDGFSSEQLDKLREVLTALGIEQLVMVSHEQRLESLADHILRVEKYNHISTIN